MVVLRVNGRWFSKRLRFDFLTHYTTGPRMLVKLRYKTNFMCPIPKKKNTITHNLSALTDLDVNPAGSPLILLTRVSLRHSSLVLPTLKLTAPVGTWKWMAGWKTFLVSLLGRGDGLWISGANWTVSFRDGKIFHCKTMAKSSQVETFPPTKTSAFFGEPPPGPRSTPERDKQHLLLPAPGWKKTIS